MFECHAEATLPERPRDVPADLHEEGQLMSLSPDLLARNQQDLPTRLLVTTLADRPHLRSGIRVLSRAWPEFMKMDSAGDLYFTELDGAYSEWVLVATPIEGSGSSRGTGLQRALCVRAIVGPGTAAGRRMGSSHPLGTSGPNQWDRPVGGECPGHHHPPGVSRAGTLDPDAAGDARERLPSRPR